jgi:hypothetical protein
MESLSPEDAYGSHFSLFVVAECGGAMLAGFCTLIRERAKARFNCRIIGNTEVTPKSLYFRQTAHYPIECERVGKLTLGEHEP